MQVKVAISQECMNVLWGLSRDKQQAVMKFMSTFRQNPTSPGINYEKIRDAADPAMRSVRISQDYRGIVLKPDKGDVYVLLWVDHHDDAYTWARRHKASIHPVLGAIQIMETSHLGPAIPEAPPEPAGLFAALKDRELIRLGVPEEQLPLVRAIQTDEQLEACTELPKTAYEALYLYAGGDSYESLILDREAQTSVDVEDYSKALERDTTRQHFLVITEDTDLDAILEGPLAAWRIFLHPSQRALIERNWSGPVRVLGGAGTGKTVVAMHRAVWLARKYMDVPGKPVLFTTFTSTLADDVRGLIATLAKPAELEKIEVTNIDQWALSILKAAGYRHQLLFDNDRRKDLWASALTYKPSGNDHLPDNFYQTEFERVVLPQGCESADDYATASRVGRGIQLNRSQRRSIWPVFAEYRAQLRAANLREPEDAYRDAFTLINRDGSARGTRAIVVDEAQDLSAAAMKLLRAAIPEGDNDLFIVGDAHQRIYRHKVTLSRVGIEVKGRSRRLRLNYRTTDEIRKWAVAQLAGCSIDDLDDQPDTLVGYRSLSHGRHPEDVTSASREEERALIADRLRLLAADGIPAQNVCLVVRENWDAQEYTYWLSSIGQPVLRLERGTVDDPAIPGIRVATMHRVKGLQFDGVILAGYRTPDSYAKDFADEEDAGAFIDHLTSERCLLHVAATRAKRYLLVSRVGKGAAKR